MLDTEEVLNEDVRASAKRGRANQTEKTHDSLVR